jgi:hypothetical protein
MGWTTWCTDDLCGLIDFCNEAEVHSIADAMVSTGMRDLGYKCVPPQLLQRCFRELPSSLLAGNETYHTTSTTNDQQRRDCSVTSVFIAALLLQNGAAGRLLGGDEPHG